MVPPEGKAQQAAGLGAAHGAAGKEADARRGAPKGRHVVATGGRERRGGEGMGQVREGQQRSGGIPGQRRSCDVMGICMIRPDTRISALNGPEPGMGDGGGSRLPL